MVPSAPVSPPPSRSSLTRRLAGQRGQSTVEWAGVLLVVALLVVGVAAVTPRVIPSITNGMTCIVKKIFGGSCESSSYVVSTQTKTVGWNGRVLIVDGSHEFTVTETRYSDGHVTITLQNDANLGVSARAGVKAELGSLGLEAQATAGIGGYGAGSTTWTFPDAKTADSTFAKLTQGSGLGTMLHDATSGGPLGGLIGDGLDVLGIHGAPSSSSVDKKYLSTQGYGGGIQASASADASAEIPSVVSAQVSASIAASGGFVKITSGAQKGDWQGVVTLNADAGGALSSDLVGAKAGASAQGDGSLVVTMSPSGQLLSLEVDATGSGTWELRGPSGPQLPSSVSIPGSSSSEGHGSSSSSGAGATGGSSGGSASGSSTGSGSGSGGGEADPLLKLSNETKDEHGVGSQFTGELDLAEHPDAAAAVSAVLHGNLSDISTVIGDMNTEGTETVRTFKATNSTDNYGVEVNAGVGVGLGTDSSSSSTTTVGHPVTRTDGGPWQASSSGS